MLVEKFFLATISGINKNYGSWNHFLTYLALGSLARKPPFSGAAPAGP